MEYLVLARKWRPQKFAEVLGQEHVVRTLSNAITQGRIAHAFLFSGPRGVGKTSVARILAKALNCQRGPAPEPCNECVSCREITAGNAIDVREIDGASNRGIDEIRELRENVKFAPAACRYTIYIIDEVHMLTREAFNALLKTLEEPPAHVVFIFATTEAAKVPATILSRCQSFDFRRIPLSLIASNLRVIAEAEGIGISDAALAWIAEAGDGSLRDSQSIFDQVISYAGRNVEDQAVEELLGRSERRFLYRISEAVLSRDAASCLRIVDEAYGAGLDMKRLYQQLLGHFRNLLLVGIVGKGDGTILPLGPEEGEALAAQAARSTPETLQRYVELLMAEEENCRRSLNPRFNVEAILCRLAWLEPLLPLDEIVSRMEELERSLGGDETPPPAGAADSAGQGPDQTADPGASQGPGRQAAAEPGQGISLASRNSRAAGKAQGEGQWEGFKAFVKAQSPVLYSKIEMGRCLACEPGILRIGFERDSQGKDHIFLHDVMEKKGELAALAGRYFGTQMDLGVESISAAGNGQGKSGLNGRASRNHQLQQLRREAISHPLLQKIMDVFPGAEVVEVRLRQTPEGQAAPPPLEEIEPLPSERQEGESAGEEAPLEE